MSLRIGESLIGILVVTQSHKTNESCSELQSVVIVITCIILAKSFDLIKWIDFRNIFLDDQIKYMSCASDTNILTFDISFICSVEKRILLFFLSRSEYPALYMFLNFPFGFQIFVFVKPINKHKRMRKPFLHFWCQGIKNDRFLQNAGWSFHSLKEEHFHNNNNDHWNRDQRKNQLYINKQSLKFLFLF